MMITSLRCLQSHQKAVAFLQQHFLQISKLLALLSFLNSGMIMQARLSFLTKMALQKNQQETFCWQPFIHSNPLSSAAAEELRKKSSLFVCICSNDEVE